MSPNQGPGFDTGILHPVWADTPAAAGLSDTAYLATLARVETTWVRVLSRHGFATDEEIELVETAAARALEDIEEITAQTALGGNALIPLLGKIWAHLPRPVRALHLGATSQDIIDTAFMLTAQSAGKDLIDTASAAVASGVRLAREHRDTPMVARSLTQHSLPTTFGYRAALWTQGLAEATQKLADVVTELPLQWGGAAGTMASLHQVLTGTGEENLDVFTLQDELAEALGLVNPVAPWDTNRQTIAQLGQALTNLILACGKIATDVATSARTEIGELAEPTAPGRGGSSAMPHKNNPVLSILIKSAALAAPAQLSQLLTGIAAADDERPSGGWHTEWPALRELLRLATGAVHKTAEILAGLRVNTDAMETNLAIAGPLLVSERIMTVLAPVLGRQVVQDVIDSYVADRNQDLVALLQDRLREAEATVPEAQRFDRETLEELTAVENYIGLAPELTDRICAQYATSE